MPWNVLVFNLSPGRVNERRFNGLEDNVVFETGIPLDSLSQRGTRTHRIGRVTSHGEGGN